MTQQGPREHESTSYKRWCLPCSNGPADQHQFCWGSMKVPLHVIGEYWCECPCGTGEIEARAVLGKEHGIPEQGRS